MRMRGSCSPGLSVVSCAASRRMDVEALLSSHCWKEEAFFVGPGKPLEWREALRPPIFNPLRSVREEEKAEKTV